MPVLLVLTCNNMGKFQRTLALTKESYTVLRANPQLSVFPVLSGLATIIVTISFFLPMILTSPEVLKGHVLPAHYVVMFAFYVISYFVVIFFNSALVSCAYQGFNGKTASVNDGLSNAARHLPAILMWS